MVKVASDPFPPLLQLPPQLNVTICESLYVDDIFEHYFSHLHLTK